MAAFAVATLSGLIAVDGEQKNLRIHRLPRVSRAMMLSRLLCFRHFSSLGLPRLRPRSPNRTEFLTYSFRRDGRAWTLSWGRCRRCVFKARTSARAPSTSNFVTIERLRELRGVGPATFIGIPAGCACSREGCHVNETNFYRCPRVHNLWAH